MKYLQRILAVLLGTGLLLLVARQGESDEAERPAAEAARIEAFKQAWQLQEAKNYAAALAVLRRLPAERGDSVVPERLAELSSLAGDHAQAVVEYQKVLRLQPRAVGPRTRLLLPLIELRRYPEAETLARQALMLDGNNYYASLRLSYVSRIVGKLNVAGSINQTMLTLYPSDANFLIEQALTCTARRRAAEAFHFYRRVLLVDPGNKYAQAGVAQVLRQEDVAMAAFHKAYELEQQKKYAEAARALAAVELMQKEEQYTQHVRLGWLYYLAGDQPRAQKHYEAAVELAPRAVEPLLGLLLPVLAEKKYEAAEKVARRALKLDAGNYLASLRLLYALRLQGKTEAADKANERLLELFPDDGQMLYERARILSALKRDAEAKKVYLRAWMMAPAG